MRIVIVDDDIVSVAIIKKLCSSFPDVQLLAEFTSGLEALEFIENNLVDLLLLDIEMPKVSGIDVINRLPEIPVIVISGFRHYAYDLFSVKNVVAYLEKPIHKRDLQLSFEKFQKLKNDRENIIDKTKCDYFFLKDNGRLVKIKISEIKYFESKGDYVWVRSFDKDILIKTTFKIILNKLSSSNFQRSHKSFVVNIDSIDSIENSIIRIGKNMIPLSRTYYQGLLTRINLIK